MYTQAEINQFTREAFSVAVRLEIHYGSRHGDPESEDYARGWRIRRTAIQAKDIAIEMMELASHLGEEEWAQQEDTLSGLSRFEFSKRGYL